MSSYPAPRSSVPALSGLATTCAPLEPTMSVNSPTPAEPTSHTASRRWPFVHGSERSGRRALHTALSGHVDHTGLCGLYRPHPGLCGLYRLHPGLCDLYRPHPGLCGLQTTSWSLKYMQITFWSLRSLQATSWSLRFLQTTYS